MNIKPVKKITPPRYPDQYTVDLDQLLLSNVPLRWRAAPLAGTVLSAVVLLGLSSCSGSGGRTPGSGDVPSPLSSYEIPEDSPEPSEEYVTMGETMPIQAQPPVFEHGEGIGVYGCVAVNAPVFLSEDDAYAIIRDEFERVNLSVSMGSGRAIDVQLPLVNQNDGMITGAQTGDLCFDFSVFKQETDQDIVLEFISRDDIRKWADNGELQSSVEIIPFLESAKVLRDGLADRSLNKKCGVFYDPSECVTVDHNWENWSESFSQAEAEAKERAAEALRSQVRDFIDWLAAQGII